MDPRYREATIRTAGNLKAIAQSQLVRDLSRLSLPEIEAVADLVAQVIPAGNIPGAILSGLARLNGRQPPPKTVRRDIDLLFRGVEQVLDQAVYAAFFAGPAAVIWGYQNLIKLAGQDPEASFPEGTWQFYADYALREDTARHANETFGFDAVLARHQIHLSTVDRITAWAMAALHCLHQFDNLLDNEWRERVYTALLHVVTAATPQAQRCEHLYRDWQAERPYARGQDAGADEPYPQYRRRKFDDFLAGALQALPAELRQRWETQVRAAEAHDLPAYQRQMSILAYLEPGAYGETRTPISLSEAQIGVIYQGRYYLIPACAPGATTPTDVLTVRAQIAGLLAAQVATGPADLTTLTRVRRAALPGLRSQLSPALAAELHALRRAPILLNCDARARTLPLAELRQAERGAGDHALTIFDTGETQVFDQSHIFFDGAWGAALADILTNEALAWAAYLHQLPPVQPGGLRLYAAPALRLPAADQELIRQAPQIAAEVSAESAGVNLKLIAGVRKLFKQRSDLLQLTVNDLLVLYRAIHAVTYQPAPGLTAELQALLKAESTRAAAQLMLDEWESARRVSPAILIPIDASQRSPRTRLYPMTFEVPLDDLDLLALHTGALAALAAYEQGSGDRTALFAEFDRLQRTYLATLAGFGAVLSRAKEIALRGESASVGSLKMLAHMPAPLQCLLDRVPGQFDTLNDIIKGREVFSNVGAVARASTLTRFITAKDDNDKKTLAWGAITDAKGVMRLTLRDFRPQVGRLAACGQRDLARRLTQDYLDAYVRGLNQFMLELRRITLASRETRLAPAEKIP